MINSVEIFQLALGLSTPWKVSNVEFKEDSTGKRILSITIDYHSASSHLYDRRERRWRHLNFFEHECFIVCQVPRIKTPEGKIETLQVPWSRKGSGFTLLFEALSMALIENEMPVNKASSLLGEYPQRIWTIFNYWISIAYAQDDQSSVQRIGIDETSTRKGHSYVTVLGDLETRRVIHVTAGKNQASIKHLYEHLKSKNVATSQVTDACIDMSRAFIAGMNEHFPTTAITFDKFHVVKLLNEAMDKVRKNEYKEHTVLKSHKYTFLKSNNNLSAQQKQDRDNLIEVLPNIGQAYRLKLLFEDFWSMANKDDGAAFLAYWCDLVEDSKIWPLLSFTKTIKAHWNGIINYLDSQIANGIMEGINSKIQLAKRRARGYRNINNFINMIYFIAGKLKFDYPLLIT